MPDLSREQLEARLDKVEHLYAEATGALNSMNTLKADIMDLEAQLRGCRSELGKLKAENELLNSNYKDLEKTHLDQKKRIEDLKKQRKALNNKLEPFTKAIELALEDKFIKIFRKSIWKTLQKVLKGKI